MKLKRLTVLFSIPLMMLAYLYFSSPSAVAIMHNGEIKDVVNTCREFLQGSRFWRNQLQIAQNELASRLDKPKRDAARHKRFNEIEKRTNESLEKMYRKYPELRPSPTQERADKLRESADELEWNEVESRLEQHRLKRIDELRAIISIIHSRATSVRNAS